MIDTASAPSISGLILAGGAGTRMGGVCKALQLLHGRPLLAWVIERLSPQVSEIQISAGSGDGTQYSAFPERVVRDEILGTGPLAGIHAGLKAARHELVVTAPCDAPFLPSDLVARLSAAMQAEQCQVAVARTTDGRQPMFTLLRREALPALTAYLASGRRKADGWYAGLRMTEVDFPDAAAFSNINSREELAALNARDGSHRS